MHLPRLCLVLLAAQFAARADMAVPPNVLDPATPAEAWNVIRLATGNIGVLLQEKRLEEITPQVSLCSPALRTLARSASSLEQKTKLDELTVRAFQAINAVAVGAMARDAAHTTVSVENLRTILAEIGALYDPTLLASEIHFCPTHTDFVSLEKGKTCAKCGLALMLRRIPYSFIYMAPGPPSLVLTAAPDAPLEAGRPATVKLQLQQRDGTPTTPRDLTALHTQPVHVLLIEPELGDFHHAHPTPTATPGEYTFSFTPKNSAPYRMWADVLPVATGVQEYPAIDLPSRGNSGAKPARDHSLTATVGGLTLTLTLPGPLQTQPRARETRYLRLTVSDAAGPVNRLEPFMNAFAHMVGIYDDYRTLVHLHPEGGEILRTDVRGGPTLGFKLFPPQPGFLRLFCQVQVEGKTIVAPFGLLVPP
jgi:hypothetical protein